MDSTDRQERGEREGMPCIRRPWVGLKPGGVHSIG